MLFTDVFIFEITRQTLMGNALKVAHEKVSGVKNDNIHNNQGITFFVLKIIVFFF
jgi:hypothetical protein